MAYKDTLVLDVHGHVSAPPAAYYMAVAMLGSNQPMPSNIGKQGGKGATEEEFRKAAQVHVDYIDARNIDVQVLGPRPYLQFGWMEPHITPGWTRYVNDMIAQQVSFHPDRFVGAAQLPMIAGEPDTKHVLAELDRCVNELGFVAAYVSPDVSGTRQQPGMDSRWFDDLYAAAQDYDIPLIVHGTNTLDPRFRDVPMNYQLAFLTEQYLAGQFLSHGDVFERFPRLRIIICHCGGALDRFISTDQHIAQKDLSENLFYDSCGYDLNFLEAAIKQRGVPRMVFGTEAPGSGGAVRPETGRTSDDLVPVLDSFGFLSDEDRTRILHDNPLKVVPGMARAGRYQAFLEGAAAVAP
ncbi:amidohydrolase [Nocardioides sp. cx-169]|uniref:amidohydrolase family protein n=1 Tax=Nocardioides sp. cx-169 TaxID=2899080 RepID=UPI001E5230FB|nr:amidohydrolase family protein [Nocardioides sp. cx-169]MCD4534283.1 amidohydrolase [Nocardioides sp. cx-169]